MGFQDFTKISRSYLGFHQDFIETLLDFNEVINFNEISQKSGAIICIVYIAG